MAVAAILVFSALYLQQQGTIRENAAASSTYTPATIQPIERDPLAAFIGDSYTTGSSATAQSRRWTSLTAATMGWIEKNMGSPGAGYLNVGEGSGCPPDGCKNYLSMTGAIIDANPAVVIVSGGRNDTGQNKDELRAATQQFFTTIREGLPEADIIATSPTWDARTPPAELEQVGDIIAAEVEAVDGTYLDLGNIFVGRPQLIGEDGVHPTDEGYELLYEAALPGVEEATQ